MREPVCPGLASEVVSNRFTVPAAGRCCGSGGCGLVLSSTRPPFPGNAPALSPAPSPYVTITAAEAPWRGRARRSGSTVPAAGSPRPDSRRI